MRQLFLLIFFIWVITSTVFPSDTKVSTVAAFNTALLIANPGDTITLANQTWQNVVINFSGKNGTAVLPIVLRAETFGSVIITGNSNLRIGGNYLIVDGLYFKNAVSASNGLVEYRSNSGTYANHSRLTNSAFVNCNPPNSTTEYSWVKMYGTYNRIDHCYFSGKNHYGPTFHVVRDKPDANYAQIDSNYFANRPNLGINGQETVKIGSGPNSLFNSNSVVEYNLFERCNGEVETISNKSCENVIRYNTFLNNEGTITLRQGRRCQVYGNFFFGNGTSSTGGIRVHGDDHRIYNNYFSGLRGDDTRSALSIENGHVVTDTTTEAQYFPVRRLLVAFNTFVSNAYNINIGIDGDGLSVVPPDSTIFVNNVIKGVSGVTQSPLILQIDTATNTTYSSNIFYGSSLGISPLPAGFINTDPLLNLQADGFYRPGSNSPLINSATGSYPFVTTDMDGQLRETLADIGADEVSSTQIIIKPVTSSDVGPWNLQLILSHITLDIKAFIEGFYYGSIMISDTVIVELHNSSSPYDLVDQAKVVLSSSGSANANFFSASDGTNYYIAIKHRNSIETWSKTTQYFSGGVLSYDFTTSANKAYGDNMKLKGTKWCIYNGDVNQDGVIDLTDVSNVDLDNLSFSTGYIATDVNGDNLIDLTDLSLVENNNLNFVTKVTP